MHPLGVEVGSRYSQLELESFSVGLWVFDAEEGEADAWGLAAKPARPWPLDMEISSMLRWCCIRRRKQFMRSSASCFSDSASLCVRRAISLLAFANSC